MKTWNAGELLPLLKIHGRTLFDEEQGALFFNWTCSGFTVTFTGKTLKARFMALGDRLPMPPDAPIDYPCVGVVIDGGEEPAARLENLDGCAWYTLLDGEEAGTHTVRVVKLSENARGKVGLTALETDGDIVKTVLPEKKLSIEFIGDSITCGFGNEAPTRDSLFTTSEENGWITYGAIAARELDAEDSFVCVSGISTAVAKYPLFDHKPMDALYPYTDRLCDERRGREPELWDFKAHKKDVVVLNLGTNDVNPVRFYKELETADEEEAHFREKYREFIETIRNLNGPDTLICCVLGPMNYYLYDDIKEVVRQYRAESGDENICSFKLIDINLMTEGFGGVGHPSARTHARVGRELASRLRALLAK